MDRLSLKFPPQDSRQYTGHEHLLRSEFTDSQEWDALAKQHLVSYNLPDWSIPCSSANMMLWLDRLNLTEGDYKNIFGGTVHDFMMMNPTWPLRAWVGLMLELARSLTTLVRGTAS